MDGGSYHDWWYVVKAMGEDYEDGGVQLSGYVSRSIRCGCAVMVKVLDYMEFINDDRRKI